MVGHEVKLSGWRRNHVPLFFHSSVEMCCWRVITECTEYEKEKKTEGLGIVEEEKRLLRI